MNNDKKKLNIKTNNNKLNPSVKPKKMNQFLNFLFSSVLMFAGMVGFAQTAYIANNTDGTVSVINVSTGSVSTTITVGSHPFGVSVSHDGNKVYITNINDATVSVINTSNNTVSATIPVGVGPQGIAVSPDGSKVYVSNIGTNTVSVINTASN